MKTPYALSSGTRRAGQARTGRSGPLRSRITNNYDHGSLYIEADGTWRVIAPTAPGPQPWGTGGDMVMWRSCDQGATWTVAMALTQNSRYNHSNARKPVHAHPDFYALWADGSPLEATPSALYFATKDGRVFRLPEKMTTATAKPELLPWRVGRPIQKRTKAKCVAHK